MHCRWLVPGLFLCAATVSPGQKIGLLRSIERQVLVSSGSSFVPGKLQQGLNAQQSLRTLRRSKAAVAFLDGFEMRVNELTQLVLLPAADMRKLKLSAGVSWFKVLKGLKVEIETPVFTAAVRGTEFELTAAGELRVYDGTVDVIVDGQTLASVKAGQTAVVKDRQVTVAALPMRDVPRSYGGPSVRWWETIVLDREDQTGDLSEASEFTPQLVADPTGNGYRWRNFNRTDENGTAQAAAAAVAAYSLLNWQPKWGNPLITLDSNWGHPGVLIAEFTEPVGVGPTRLSASAEFESRSGKIKVRPQWGKSLSADMGLGDGIRLTAGRFHYQPTVVPLDFCGLRVVGEDYSGLKIQADRGPLQATAAWLADIDTFALGQQPALAGSVRGYWGPLHLGVVGRARTSGVRDSAIGFEGAVAVLPGYLNLYGEASQTSGGRDGGGTGKAFTLGFNVPWLSTQAGLDSMAEFQHREGKPSAWMLWLSKDFGPRFRLGAQWGLRVGGSSACGVAASFRF